MMNESITWEDLPALMGDVRAMAWHLLGPKDSKNLLDDLIQDTMLRLLEEKSALEVKHLNRQQFLSYVNKRMEARLIDLARKRRRELSHRKTWEEVHPENVVAIAQEHPEQIEALALALQRLNEKYPELAEVAEFRYLSGYTVKETAQVMEIGERTVRRWWEQAQVLLREVINQIVNDPGAAEATQSHLQDRGQDSQETLLTPELREWAVQQFSEEDFVAGFQEIRETGGLTFRDFIESLEEAAGRQ